MWSRSPSRELRCLLAAVLPLYIALPCEAYGGTLPAPLSAIMVMKIFLLLKVRNLGLDCLQLAKLSTMWSWI